MVIEKAQHIESLNSRELWKGGLRLSHRWCSIDPHVTSPLQHRSSMLESLPDDASSVNPLLPPLTGSPQMKMAGTVLSPVTDFNVFRIIAPSTPSLFTSNDLNWVPMDANVSLATSQYTQLVDENIITLFSWTRS